MKISEIAFIAPPIKQYCLITVSIIYNAKPEKSDNIFTMKNILIFLLILFLSVDTAFAQTKNREIEIIKDITDEITEVFSPFVSRIKAEEENQSVKITWKDSKNIKGTYIIYRYTEEITQSNFIDAFPVAEVTSGKEQYIDTTTGETPFCYAIVLKDEYDKTPVVFLPYRNTTVSPVSIKKADDLFVKVKNIIAVNRDDTIYLTFTSSTENRKLAVLRSTESILLLDNLINADILNIIASEKYSYTDYPSAGIPYYYSIVDAELLEKPNNIILIPNQNVTVKVAEIPLPNKKDIRLRVAPLPFIRLPSKNYY